MPFKSRSQQKFMFAKKPKIAKRWAKKYGVPKDLPSKVKKTSAHKTSHYNTDMPM